MPLGEHDSEAPQNTDFYVLSLSKRWTHQKIDAIFIEITLLPALQK